MHQPLVSIVMPAYNAEKFIEESVNSILQQTYRNFELLVADDSSTDKTKEILSSFNDSRISIYENEINQGYLITCNRLFSLCKGDLITFQDADDISDIYRIEKLVRTFLNDTDVDICTTNSTLVDENGKKISSRVWPIDYQRFRYDINYKPTICGATIILTKELLNKTGLYHEYFNRAGGEDFEWFYRAVTKCKKAVHVNEELYIYRIHNSAVKSVNTAPLYTDNIIDEIRKHFILHGEYLLDNKYQEKLMTIEEKYKQEFTNDPSRTLRIKANGAIAAKEYVNFLKLSWVTFKTEPTNPKNYTAFFGSIYNRFKGIIYNLLNQTK